MAQKNGAWHGTGAKWGSAGDKELVQGVALLVSCPWQSLSCSCKCSGGGLCKSAPSILPSPLRNIAPHLPSPSPQPCTTTVPVPSDAAPGWCRPLLWDCQLVSHCKSILHHLCDTLSQHRDGCAGSGSCLDCAASQIFPSSACIPSPFVQVPLSVPCTFLISEPTKTTDSVVLGIVS